MRGHVLLYDPEDPKSFEPDAVYKRRTEHLKETYGLGFLLVRPPHEMPENTLTPKPPTSTHCNFHSSIARVWSALPPTTDWNLNPIDTKTLTSLRSTTDLVWNNDEGAITAFVTAVRIEICAGSGRGDIHQASIEDEIREVLPSFFKAMTVAGSGVHDWKKNTLRDKITYELALREG